MKLYTHQHDPRLDEPEGVGLVRVDLLHARVFDLAAHPVLIVFRCFCFLLIFIYTHVYVYACRETLGRWEGVVGCR